MRIVLFVLPALELGWSTPADMWAVACIILECFLGRPVFDTHNELEQLAMTENLIGVMPAGFRARAKYVGAFLSGWWRTTRY